MNRGQILETMGHLQYLLTSDHLMDSFVRETIKESIDNLRGVLAEDANGHVAEPFRRILNRLELSR